MVELAEIEDQLKVPFPLHEIGLLPKGKFESGGQTKCMGLPYADPRAYEDRLNALAPGQWQTPTPVALAVGNKLIVFVTVIICGIPHTDVGEADPGENQGTEAWAQAFKRACSQFGLGRYLYDLEKEIVPFNTGKKQIDLDKSGKTAIVKRMYQKAGITLSPPGPITPTMTQPPMAVQKPPTTPSPVAVVEAKGEGKGAEESSTGEGQVQVIDADFLIPEKARIIIGRLEKDLGMFEIGRFKEFLGLSSDQNLYAPHLWQGSEGEALMKRAVNNLELWLKKNPEKGNKTHPEREKWLAQPILPEQHKKIVNTLVPEEREARHRLAFERNPASIQSFFVSALRGDTAGFDEARLNAAYTKANSAAVSILAGVIDQDKGLHGKKVGQFTAGEADRFISYFDPENGNFENNVFTPNIPEEFLYKGPTKTVAAA